MFQQLCQLLVISLVEINKLVVTFVLTAHQKIYQPLEERTINGEQWMCKIPSNER